MFQQLIEFALGRIIGVMVHKREVITYGESVVQDAYMAKLEVMKRKTAKPVIIAMIGLVGSGKSSVARELGPQIGATVINADDIRVELRKAKEGFEHVRAIAEDVALAVVKQGGNVILDSDFIDAAKRASLREKARKVGARVEFICVYADFDVMAGRIITSGYRDHADDFFGGAESKWQGSAQSKGAVVAMRELWRRTPLHYRWINKGGGRWEIKNPPCVVVADIDTADSALWRREVAECAKKLLAE